MKSDIKLAFDQRLAFFETSTASIMTLVVNVTKAIETFFRTLPAFTVDTLFTWINAELVSDGQHVTIYAMIFYKVGSVFVSDTGERITVTDDNVNYLNRPIQIQLPLEVVELNDYSVTLEYLSTVVADTIDNNNPASIPTASTNVSDGKLINKSFPGKLSADECRRLLLSAKNPSGVQH